MKAQNYSWWIGGIVGAILTLTLTGGTAQDKLGMLIIVGLVSGAFWGWILGLLIDKMKGTLKPTLDYENKDVNQKEVPGTPPVKKREYTGLSAQIAMENVKITSRGNTFKDVMTVLFQGEMDTLIESYKKENATELHDPLLGPLKLMNFINAASEEVKKSLFNTAETGGLTNEEVDEIMANIHNNTLTKNLK